MILFSLFNFSIVDSSFQGRETIYCFISCQNLEFVLFQVLINLISRFYRNCVESVFVFFLIFIYLSVPEFCCNMQAL